MKKPNYKILLFNNSKGSIREIFLSKPFALISLSVIFAFNLLLLHFFSDSYVAWRSDKEIRNHKKDNELLIENMRVAENRITNIEEKIYFYNSVDEKEIPQNIPETIVDKFHKEDFQNCKLKEKMLIIEAVLDQAIRPALANDGGGIDVLGIEGNVINVHYQGACGTCPSSTTGTLSYIETFLKDTLHRDLTVIAQ